MTTTVNPPQLTETVPLRTGSLVNDTLVVAHRNIIRFLRTPQLMIFTFVQPVMFILLFRFVFGGAINSPDLGGSYVDFLIPGIIVQAMLFSGASTAVGIADDISTGVIDRFRSLPMARGAVLAGRTLADLVRTTMVVAVMILVGTAVGFRFHNGFIPGLAGLAVAISFAFAFSWFFAFVGQAVNDPETAQMAGMLPTFPLTFAATTFVPLATMPSWLQAFARNQPVTHVVNSVRALTQGGEVAAPLTLAVVWIVGLTALFASMAVRRYRRI